MKKARDIDALVERFDKLPDDAIVPDTVSARVLSTSPWTIRRNRLLPYRQISERFRGNRVGDIRAVARGEAIAV
jgi:hypothetical protein